MGVVEAIIAKDQARKEEVIRKSQQAAETRARRLGSDVERADELARNRDATEKKEQIRALELQLLKLDQRIKTARNERVEKGYPPDGGSRYTYYRQYRATTATLGKDASQIKELLSERLKLEYNLQVLRSGD